MVDILPAQMFGHRIDHEAVDGEEVDGGQESGEAGASEDGPCEVPARLRACERRSKSHMGMHAADCEWAGASTDICWMKVRETKTARS